MNDKRGIRIGIATAVIAIAMLAMVPGAAAYAVITVGTIQFENGTTCPYGWTVCEENLNETWPECLEASGEPWCEPTYECPPFWNYLVTGGACAGPDVVYFKLTATSPDGKWYAEKTFKLEDAWEADHPGCGFYEVNLVVSEVPLETETFTKDLAAGWNLVSLPLTPEDNSVSAVLGSIPFDAVKSYNATTHQFEDATTMDPGVGYYIHMTADDTWSYIGTAYESINVSLSQGLNMVGWLNCSKDISDALSSIEGEYSYVARWNVTTHKFEVYLPDAPSLFNDFDTMDRGEGYFISMKVDGERLIKEC